MPLSHGSRRHPDLEDKQDDGDFHLHGEGVDVTADLCTSLSVDGPFGVVDAG